MPFYTSVIKVPVRVNILNRVKRDWKDEEEQEKAENFLNKFFTKVEFHPYDSYFRFPKGSLVCIKQSTPNELLIDCFSHKASSCAIDFSMVLRRLADISDYTIDTIGFETENPSLTASVIDAFIPGGVLLLLIPAIIENAIPISFRLASYFLTAIIYTLSATIYFRSRGH
jgi:hypothetical protein